MEQNDGEYFMIRLPWIVIYMCVSMQMPQYCGDFFLILAQSADMSSNNQNVPQDITASVENR